MAPGVFEHSHSHMFQTLQAFWNLFGNKPVAEIRPALREIGNLALLVTARSSNRATPALSLFADVIADRRIIDTMAPVHSREDRGPYYATHVKFSGKEAIMLYKLACKKQARLSSVFNVEKAKQVVFHSWWGTALEDFSHLSHVCDNAECLKRSDFGASFQKIGSTLHGDLFDMITYQKYSKLASANLSGLLVQWNARDNSPGFILQSVRRGANRRH